MEKGERLGAMIVPEKISSRGELGESTIMERKVPEGMKSVSPSVMSDSFATPRTVACQAPLSTGFLARILEWVATSLGDFPDLRVETRSATFQADSLPPESQGKPTPEGIGG